MAFNKAPTEWIASWSEDGTDVTFPLASVTDLTAAEADATTGDLRAIAFRLVESLYQHISGLATADAPGQLTITRNRFESGTSIAYRYLLTVNTGVETTVTAES
jgi:hypothetical protein